MGDEFDASIAMGTSGLITERAYARIGLLGNPSDGYFGKTISVSITNFFSEVSLQPQRPSSPSSSRVSFEPGPFDSNEFATLGDLADATATHGYYGGIRLLRALCYKFHAYCREHAIPLHSRGFTMSYTTNIPKQTGLSGSSSIIVAGLKCLMRHYGVEIPLERRPALVLSCEADLGITAGLQDRVIQCYEGVVYMDFSDRALMAAEGRGTYERLPDSCLPPLHLVYDDGNPSDSGKVHSTVKQRWEAGDELIRTKMEAVAQLALRGRATLLGQSFDTGGSEEAATIGAGGPESAKVMDDNLEFAKLMDANFDLRREMFGDAALGARNLDMVMTPRSVGAAAKFTGSGGAVVAFCPRGDGQVRELYAACEAKGFTVCAVAVNPAPPPPPTPASCS